MEIATLLDDRYAPITSSIGFLKLPLDDTAEALAAWWRSLAPPVSVEPLDESFEEALAQLDPLEVGSRSRALLVEQDDGWTAYFDCLATGTDPVSAIGYLAQVNRTAGVSVTTIRPSRVRSGSIQFGLYGPAATDFLNHVRGVAVARDDGGRWRFIESGTPQEFERLDAYRLPRVEERFTSEMLHEYCRALGFRPYEASAYGKSILVRSKPPVEGGIETVPLAVIRDTLGYSSSEYADGNRPRMAWRSARLGRRSAELLSWASSEDK